ncbi:MAG: ribosome-associated translation inhibitor RaiA [Rhodobacteraceae bacterium]|nr:ribosome-associated translation inhibitor RaiA [Paracoccaceae bacterium]
MRIEVVGKQLDVGQALRGRIEERLAEAVSKHANRPVEAIVRISRNAHLFKCDCSAHLSTGLKAQASGSDSDVYAACDQAIARLEKQLRRYKRRLKDHHQRRKEPIRQLDAMAYVLSSVDESSASESPQTDASDEWRPMIIAESRAQVPTLSVGEAVMQMELSNENFLLFLNNAQTRLNAVYRRDDGNVGWLDPAGEKAP